MKSVRFLLPLLLLLCTFSLCGCTSKEEKKIEDAVKQELDQLKNLDSITTQKYISYQELFPGEPEDIAISSDIEIYLKKKELVKLFDHFLSTLSERDRDIFIRRYWYMDPVKAIADRHACGESKIKSVLARSRKKLYGLLKEAGYEG